MPFQSSRDWFDDEEEKKPRRRRRDAPISPLARPKWTDEEKEYQREKKIKKYNS